MHMHFWTDQGSVYITTRPLCNYKGNLERRFLTKDTLKVTCKNCNKILLAYGIPSQGA